MKPSHIFPALASLFLYFFNQLREATTTSLDNQEPQSIPKMICEFWWMANRQNCQKWVFTILMNQHLIRVLDGEAVVSDGERSIKVKSGHLVDLATSGPIKELEAKALYRWASLCSGYLAEANVDYAANYSFGANGWIGERWYWNPSFRTYTSLPGDGIFLRPFGWRFYSSRCLYAAPSTTII